MVSSEALKARKSLIQQTFDEICVENDINCFYNHTHCVLSKYWLHIKAEEEGIFTPKEAWSNIEYREQMIHKLRIFLAKHKRQRKNTRMVNSESDFNENSFENFY